MYILAGQQCLADARATTLTELRAKAQRLKDVERGNIQAVARLLEQTK